MTSATESLLIQPANRRKNFGPPISTRGYAPALSRANSGFQTRARRSNKIATTTKRRARQEHNARKKELCAELG
jgi:hypothetical protein